MSWADGGDLANPVFGHCLVDIGDENYLMIGGKEGGDPYDQAFIYKWENGQANEMSNHQLIVNSQQVKLYKMSCHSYSESDGSISVFILGGEDDSGTTPNKVDFFNDIGKTDSY